MMKQEIMALLDSSSHSRDLAMVMARSSNGFELGIDDTAQCVKALSFHASRWRRRAGIAVAFAFVAALAIGLPDIDHDGRVNLADVRIAATAVVGLTTSNIAKATEHKS